MCLYPRLIRNRKYVSNKKNGGDIPVPSDIRVIAVPVGCGDCIECRKQKAREWQCRLLEDIKTDYTLRTNKEGMVEKIPKGKPKFITLTFSNESIKKLIEETVKITNKKTGEIEIHKISTLEGYQRDNAIATRAMRLFNERWRKEHKKALRHWMVTELGHNGTENIHLHGVVWTDEDYNKIRKIWKYGWIWPRPENDYRTLYVNSRTVNYIIKYITKKDEKHTGYKSVILTSPGIGSNYTTSHDCKKNKYNNTDTNETYRTSTGHKISLPIYWRNKIYTDEQKEQLWLNRLNKKERWVCGERIDISKNNELYYKTLQYYRHINAQLGYGNGDKSTNKIKYEQQRRQFMLDKRIQNTASGGV